MKNSCNQPLRHHWAKLAVATVVVAGHCWVSSASSTNYGSFTGATVTYADVTEFSGTDPGVPLWLAPQVFGDTLDFSPNMTANSVGGIPKITDAQLNLDINANPGYGIVGLQFSEAGDFTMAGQGTANTLVDVSAFFFMNIVEVDNVVINPVFIKLSMTYSPNLDGTFTLVGAGGPPHANGTWSGSISVDFNEALASAGINYTLGATKVKLAMSNTLTAVSEANTQAFIAKKDAKGLAITVIPEPSTAAISLLAAALFAGWRASRRTS